MTKFRRFVGYTALAMGAISTVVFLSPIFPIGVEALLVGGVFFVAGAWALAAPADLGKILRRAVRTARTSPVSIDPLLPVRILALARKNGGIVTVSDVAIELNVPLEEAQEGLRSCVRAGSASEDFDISRGYSRFRFPEFLPPADRRPPE